MIINFKMLGQNRNGSCDSENSEFSSALLVCGLFKPCSPSTIAGFVISIIVNSIKREPVRSVAHIFQEVFEFHPTATNSDSSASIIAKAFKLRVGASLDHCGPRMIFWTKFLSERVSVFCESFFSRFRFKTSTGSGYTSPKTIIVYHNSVSTVADTLAHPGWNSVWTQMAVSFRGYFKPSKSLSNYTNFSRHSIASFNVVFSSRCLAHIQHLLRFYKFQMDGQL